MYVTPKPWKSISRRVAYATTRIAAALFVFQHAAADTPETKKTQSVEATAPAAASTTGTATPAKPKPDMDMELFLDRLMMSESGGRDFARSSTSTALGPFQFLQSTFLEVSRTHFAAETSKLAPAQVLALRTDRAFARRAAEAYTRDNAAFLQEHGITPTFPRLRLAYLVGASAAVRVLSASPETSVARILGPTVIRANPFMRAMTAKDLIARTAHDISVNAGSTSAIVAARRSRSARPKPQIQVRCNLQLPSCKRWRSLAAKRLSTRPQKIASN